MKNYLYNDCENCEHQPELHDGIVRERLLLCVSRVREVVTCGGRRDCFEAAPIPWGELR